MGGDGELFSRRGDIIPLPVFRWPFGRRRRIPRTVSCGYRDPDHREDRNTWSFFVCVPGNRKKNTGRQTKRGTGGGPRVCCSSKLMGDSWHLEHRGEERGERRGKGVL